MYDLQQTTYQKKISQFASIKEFGTKSDTPTLEKTSLSTYWTPVLTYMTTM